MGRHGNVTIAKVIEILHRPSQRRKRRRGYIGHDHDNTHCHGNRKVKLTLACHKALVKCSHKWLVELRRCQASVIDAAFLDVVGRLMPLTQHKPLQDFITMPMISHKK